MNTTDIIKIISPALIAGIFRLLSVWLKHRLENPQQRRAGTASVKIDAVLRDVGTIWFLTFLAGFLPSMVASAAGKQVPMSIVLGAGYIFEIIGFIISGSRAQSNRWKHLFVVAIVTWLSTALNVMFSYLGFFAVPISLRDWLSSIFYILLTMGVGGVISYVFNRR